MTKLVDDLNEKWLLKFKEVNSQYDRNVAGLELSHANECRVLQWQVQRPLSLFSGRLDDDIRDPSPWLHAVKLGNRRSGLPLLDALTLNGKGEFQGWCYDVTDQLHPYTIYLFKPPYTFSVPIRGYTCLENTCSHELTHHKGWRILTLNENRSRIFARRLYGNPHSSEH